VTPVPTPGNNTAPSYTFSSDENGTVAVGGSCGTAIGTTVIADIDKTITLTQPDNSSALADGTYENCTITVSDADGNDSNPLPITAFEIDTTPPEVDSIEAPDKVTNDDPFVVTIEFSEAVSFLPGKGLAVTNADWVTPKTLDSITHTVDILPTGGGYHHRCGDRRCAR
jgi:hypothetical protein